MLVKEQSVQNSKKKLLRNVAALGIVQVINYVFPLISIPIISRIIGPENFGSINYIASFVGYFTLLISFGFDLSATRRIAHDPHNLKLRIQVFNEVFFAQLLLFMLSVMLFILCLKMVPSVSGDKQVAVFTFLICVSTVLTQNWLFQAMQQLKKVAVLSIIGKLFFTIGVLLVVRTREQYIWQPLVNSCVQILVSLGSFVYAYKMFNLRFEMPPVVNLFLVLKTESMVFFSMVVINLYTITNMVMLGAITSYKEVGYYAAALRLIQVFTSIVNVPLSQAIFPYVGEAFGVSREAGFSKIREMLPVVFWFTLLLSLGTCLFGPFILTWFYGEEFKPSVMAFEVLSFIPVILAINNILGTQVMLNQKMDRPFFLITLGGAGIGLVLNYVMIKNFGFIGTAWNWVIVELYITLAMYIYLKANGIELFQKEQFKFSNLRIQLGPFITRFFKK